MTRQRLDMMIKTVDGFVDLTGSEIRILPVQLHVSPARIPVRTNSRDRVDNFALDKFINKYLRLHPNIVPAQATAYHVKAPAIEEKMVYYQISFYRL